MSESRKLLAIGAAVWLLAALDAFWMGRADLPCPRGVDDAFYKSPGAELALNGRLAQPAVIGYLPRADEVFACYPPLYALAVGGWFWLFGVTTTASVAFGHVIHLLNMAAIMVLVAAMLRPIAMSLGRRAFAVAAAGIAFFGILRFFDRQEELALLFGLVETLFYVEGRARGLASACASGLLIGLAAVTSPWAGLVLLGVALLRELLAWRREASGSIGRMAALSIAAALPAAAWVTWLESRYPGSFQGVFLYHLRISEHRTIFDASRKALASLLHSPYELPALLLTFAFFPRLLAAEMRKSVPTAIFALFFGGSAALVFALVMRANSYNYIWFCLFLLIPCFGYVAGRLLADSRPQELFFPLLMIGLCTLVTLRDPVSLSLVAHDLPADERPGPIFARLKKAIPPGEPVATTSRYWYLFQGRNPWRLTAIYPHLSEEQRRDWVDWIVVPVDHLSPEDRAIVTSGFELVESVPSDYSTLAPSFSLEDRTWAYELYRRRQQR